MSWRYSRRNSGFDESSVELSRSTASSAFAFAQVKTVVNKPLLEVVHKCAYARSLEARVVHKCAYARDRVKKTNALVLWSTLNHRQDHRRITAGSMLDQHWITAGSTPDQRWITAGSPRDHRRINAGSPQDHHGNNAGSTQDHRWDHHWIAAGSPQDHL